MVGAIITLVVVRWTINSNESIRSKQNRFEYDPIFKIRILQNEEAKKIVVDRSIVPIQMNFNNFNIIEDKYSVRYYFGFSIVNLGKGFATDVLIKLDEECRGTLFEKSIRFIEPLKPVDYIFYTLISDDEFDLHHCMNWPGDEDDFEGPELPMSEIVLSFLYNSALDDLEFDEYTHNNELEVKLTINTVIDGNKRYILLNSKAPYTRKKAKM